eukprot:1136845-Pelagomonas_calceolata.AAC.7
MGLIAPSKHTVWHTEVTVTGDRESVFLHASIHAPRQSTRGNPQREGYAASRYKGALSSSGTSQK